MNLSEIKTNPNNPRVIKDARFKQLKKSIEDLPHMMVLRPIVVDETGTVLGGNMRLEALKSLGYKDIPDEWVKRTDELSEEQKKEFVIKDNAGFGEWDWDLLANEWSEYPLADWGVDVPDDWAASPKVEEDESAVADMIDRAAELQKKWKTKTGQLWEIPSVSASGQTHRLLCGDSTNKADVGRLCGENRPLLMVTDPPYGVNYDPQWRADAAEAGHLTYAARRVGEVQNDDRRDWTETWQLFPGNVAYIWHAGRYSSEVQQSIESADFEIRSQIVWAKSNFPISRGHYHWRHEPCWYAFRKGKSAGWIGDRTQTTLWEINLDKNVAGGHSTQKPLECMARPIRNHEGDVYDPFVGSGTTIVAAEQNKRACYAMEISSDYVAVTLERLSALGLTPKLLET